MAIEIKGKINKWDPIKLTSFRIAKKKKTQKEKTIYQMEKILVNDATNRVLPPNTQTAHTNQQQKNKQPNGKMSKKPK